jgi:hypothetical protein
MKPRLLDLFCGVGGASMGYHRAGFEVVGVDIRPQPNYPFEFHQADAVTFPLDGFDVIAASPPCQAYSHGTNEATKAKAPELIEPIRDRLSQWGGVWVIENVRGAAEDLSAGLLLCGSMFDLAVTRHRLFESSVFLWAPGNHHCASVAKARAANPIPATWKAEHRGRNYGVTGHSRGRGTEEFWGRIMGIPWAKKTKELTEAIPPAYTEWIGQQLLTHVGEVAA